MTTDDFTNCPKRLRELFPDAFKPDMSGRAPTEAEFLTRLGNLSRKWKTEGNDVSHLTGVKDEFIENLADAVVASDSTNLFGWMKDACMPDDVSGDIKYGYEFLDACIL